MNKDEEILFQYGSRIKLEFYSGIFIAIFIAISFVGYIIVNGIEIINLFHIIFLLFAFSGLILVFYHIKMISKIKITNLGFYLPKSVYIPVEDIKIISKPKHSHNLWIETNKGKRYFIDLNRNEWNEMNLVLNKLSLINKLKTNS